MRSPLTIESAFAISPITWDFFAPFFFSIEMYPEGMYGLEGTLAGKDSATNPVRLDASLSSSSVGSFTDLSSGIRRPACLLAVELK